MTIDYEKLIKNNLKTMHAEISAANEQIYIDIQKICEKMKAASLVAKQLDVVYNSNVHEAYLHKKPMDHEVEDHLVLSHITQYIKWLQLICF